MTSKFELTREENLAFEFAHHWRAADYHPDLQGVDWVRFAKLLSHNRMGVMALKIIQKAGLSDQMPQAADQILKEQADKYESSASRLGEALTTYLHAAAANNLDTIILKGLWLCEKIYQVPAMRPGGDIDILVPRDQVQASLALLEKQGIGEFWPNLLRDEYFTRHHLHQQRSTQDLAVWFEIHWALDHPYTSLTVDYKSIFERARPGELLGAPIREMAASDLLLSLAIHLVKHAVYLPSLIERADLPRIILADGMLMYYLDVAEVLGRFSDQMDWELTVQLTRDWGAVDILGSVLQVCGRYFGASVPAEVLSALPITGPWAITRRLMARAAEQELAAYQGLPESRLWKLILMSNGAFILRPVRLLETMSYFLPGSDFLRRRYGHANFFIRIRHLIKAVFQTLRFVWDTFYFGMERYARLKRQGKNTSLFNTLETDL
jgi:hypothetical protein